MFSKQNRAGRIKSDYQTHEVFWWKWHVLGGRYVEFLALLYVVSMFATKMMLVRLLVPRVF